MGSNAANISARFREFAVKRIRVKKDARPAITICVPRVLRGKKITERLVDAPAAVTDHFQAVAFDCEAIEWHQLRRQR